MKFSLFSQGCLDFRAPLNVRHSKYNKIKFEVIENKSDVFTHVYKNNKNAKY